ncbi:MAG: NAD(P)-dependent oxidoreductase [Rhodospirillales bacterium]|nr:NAD(P)-dependent oxidoreductase [Rhodospirillales bacterium]
MRIGFIGLGTMGGSMAANLQKSGAQLVVHDLHRQAAGRHLADGAEWAETPEAVAHAADVVFTSLPAPPDVEAVGAGLAAGMRPGSAWFDLSTNSLSVVRALAARLAEQGVTFLDAPVSGGPKGAASGRLAIWVGGDADVFARHKGLLEAMGDRARLIGPVGAGTIAKLTHNAAGAAINLVLAEVFTMGVKAGVEPLALWEAIRQGATGRNRTFDRMGDHFLPGSYDPPEFAFRLIHKDVSLAAELGREVGVPMRMVNLALAEMTEALNRGWGGRDSRVSMALQEERSGIAPLKVDPREIKAALERDG